MIKERHKDVIVARERAHAVFDLLWACKLMSKKSAYAWLQKEFGRPKMETHIGRMSIEECARIEKQVAALLFDKAFWMKEYAKHQSRADTTESKAKTEIEKLRTTLREQAIIALMFDRTYCKLCSAHGMSGWEPSHNKRCALFVPAVQP